MSIQTYKDLDVFKSSYNLSLIICLKVVPKLPKEEQFDLSDQLRRSSKAIPRLIAEGYGKRHQKKGFQKYLDDALSECNETVVSLCHVRDLYFGQINAVSTQKIIEQYEIIGKQIYKLKESWNKYFKLIL